MSSRRRPALLVFILLIAVGAFWGARGLGRFLVVDDPLVRADAAVVLGGSRLERALEASDLYAEGWVSRVVLSRQFLDGGEQALVDRGVPFTQEGDLQKQVLVATGIPADRVEFLPRPAVSTADEAAMIAGLATSRGWSRVIVVTSKVHTARAALVIRRHLAGTGVSAALRATRYDPSDLTAWWRNRSDLKVVPFEAQRYLLYWLGLAD